MAELVIATIKEILVRKTGRDPESILERTLFLDDLGLGSIEAIELLAEISETLDVMIDEEEMVGADDVAG